MEVPGGEPRVMPKLSPPLLAQSSAQALDDGDTAMRAGAALQRWLRLHQPAARIKGEDTIGAFPVFVPPTKDVDLPITHRHATALLSRQTDRQLTGMEPGTPLVLSWPSHIAEPCPTD